MYIFQGLVQVATFSFKALQSCCSRCRQEEPKSANQNVGESSPLLSSEKRNESEDELTIDSLPLDAEEQTQHSLTAEFESFSKSMEAVKICLIHTTLYYTLAIVGYSFLVEKWSIIDSLYFSTTIFTTIGYGDLAPTNVYAECYTMCLALYGIVLLGLFLGIAGEKIIDGQNKAIQESQEKLRKRIMQGSSNGLQAGAKAITESMRENARERSLLEEIGEVFVLELPILAVVILLMTIAGYFEGWTWFQSIYYAVITGTTIGFGDVSPKTPGVRLACCFLLPLAVAVLGEFLARIASVYINRKTRKAERQFLKRAMTLSDLDIMDTDKDGKVQRGEFLAFMLVALQKVDKADIDELLQAFDALDVSKTGEVNKEDVMAGKWAAMLRNAQDGFDDDSMSYLDHSMSALSYCESGEDIV